ncbi:hypothetical protein [Paenibacillus sp. YSY-4.3]
MDFQVSVANIFSLADLLDEVIDGFYRPPDSIADSIAKLRV